MADSIADSKRRLVEDFNAVVEDTQKLLNALAASGTEKGTALRASADALLSANRRRPTLQPPGSVLKAPPSQPSTDAEPSAPKPPTLNGRPLAFSIAG